MTVRDGAAAKEQQVPARNRVRLLTLSMRSRIGVNKCHAWGELTYQSN